MNENESIYILSYKSSYLSFNSDLMEYLQVYLFSTGLHSSLTEFPKENLFSSNLQSEEKEKEKKLSLYFNNFFSYVKFVNMKFFWKRSSLSNLSSLNT